MNRKEHWDEVYDRKRSHELTWFQKVPAISLSLIRQTGLPSQGRILDVGGGTSQLPSFLLQEGFLHLSVLDVSERGLEVAKAQLGARADEIEWFHGDLLDFDPPHRWDLWHDRALFHFLTSGEDREAYFRVLNRCLEPGGHLIIATFAPEGPSRCSGLDCLRYGPEDLQAVLGSGYQLRGSVEEAHATPSGGTQDFVYSWFRRE